ncbi:Sn1-specific diacylglycerol lipase alpha [Chionoecetes opilio]|uniref:sn-1-specific diacylglycerol lipase n=1 Tax=Chionoecetes opilio TaxID=41210 RepID=A0A8J5D0H6_CHIOP|nr:Sn1-specific diacylglycerol lipase alpha [Chionoecetes opilio]
MFLYFLSHDLLLIVLAVIYGVVGTKTSNSEECWTELREHIVGYLVILSGCVVVEFCIAHVAMRGTILDPSPRSSMQYLLYVRLGIVVCNWLVMVSVVLTVWCTFDAAGRSWVKMKRYQRSMRDTPSKFQYRRSGNRNRNWRHRKVLRAYQDSWDHRCRLLFCCMGKSDDSRNSFSDIARLLSEFFRDLDVVPSDVVAGLVLLRKYQKLNRQDIVKSNKNDVYEFLSGVPITPSTRFLQLSSPEGKEEFEKIVHYMRFALAIYGWPMFVVSSSTAELCRLCPMLGCWRCCASPAGESEVVEDNCCGCNVEATRRMIATGDIDLVYTTYHVDVGETPFFVALDHKRRAVVLSIRGTLSMKDVVTDLNAESEPIPMDQIREDWLGHKVRGRSSDSLAIPYSRFIPSTHIIHPSSAGHGIRRKLRDDNILTRALTFDLARGTQTYDLVLVGHSLGAGTASILAILLKQQHPNLCCFAYSPPGGLLSMPVVEHTRSFITSVVVGKDVVPRIGLHQMEAMRADLINAIQRSKDPKWKTIGASVRCCGAWEDSGGEAEEFSTTRAAMRDHASHPSDSSIALTVHQPLYHPGRILHVVRNHPDKRSTSHPPPPFRSHWLGRPRPVYQAVWRDNQEFDEVLVSPCMIQDHMPDKVLKALEKVLSPVREVPVAVCASTNTQPSLHTPSKGTTAPFFFCLLYLLSSSSYQPSSPISSYLLLSPPILLTPPFSYPHLMLAFSSYPPVLESPGPRKPQRNQGPSPSRRKSSVYHDGEARNLLTPSCFRASPTHNTPSPRTSPVTSTPLVTSRSANRLATTPPHKLLLETSFTCTPAASPEPPFDLRHHARLHSPAITWELLSALEDQLLLGIREAGRSFGEREDEWVVGVAPLASPETLSEASSIVSRASLLLREGRRHGSVPPAAPHQQSPSPLLNRRPPPARLGMGYCFYVETPPLEARRQQLLAAERLPESSDDEEIPARPLSPAPYITLDTMLPTSPLQPPAPTHNETPATHGTPSTPSTAHSGSAAHPPVQNAPGTSRTQEEGSGRDDRGSPDSPGSGHSPDSSSSSSSTSSSSSSSTSSQVSHRVKFDITASQMSRDSGYGERLNGNLSGTSGEWGAGGMGGACVGGKGGVWGHQQEYGRGQAPLVHHYLYSGVSPQHSPLSPANTDSFTSPLTSDPPAPPAPSLEVPRLAPSSSGAPAGLHHNPHPLYKATPLLHDLSRAPKVIPVVPRTSQRAESSV